MPTLSTVAAARLPFRQLVLMPWRWNRWIGILAVPLMLVAYPLSVGPVVWLYEKGYMSDSLAETVSMAYLPVTLAAESSPAAEYALNWYLEWWAPDADTY